jgi:capsular polysaccharide biosynthesis protein
VERPYYDSVLEWVESQTGAAGTKASYRKLFDASTIEFPEPKALEPVGDTFRSIRTFEVPEAYAAAIPDGYVCGNGYRSRTAILAPDRKLIWDVSTLSVLARQRAENQWQGHWLFGQPDLPRPTEVRETTGVLAVQPQWARGYYHWMLEVLPRIHLLRGSGIPIEKYVVNACKSRFQDETLTALGIDEASRIEVEPDEPFCVRARELVVPSDVPLVSPAWACAFVRGEFLGGPIRGGRRRLYVSRRTADARKVLNEDEVSEVLATFGFEEVVADQLSIPEQAETFASASVVVGPHGAGLTNLVFCKPQTKVVEFFAPRYIQPAYFMLANQCRLSYHYLVGRGEPPATWSWPESDGAQDPIEVDPDQLVALLRKAGL